MIKAMNSYLYTNINNKFILYNKNFPTFGSRVSAWNCLKA